MVTLGCFLWILSFFLEINLFYPYSRVGVWLSVFLTLFGSLIWWLKRNEHKFNNSTEEKIAEGKNWEVSIDVPFGDISIFWTFCIIFWMILVLGYSFLSNGSQAEVFAKHYLENDSIIISKTNGIRAYSLISGGELSNESANIDIGIIANNNNNFRVNILLKKDSNHWKVTETSYK